LLFLGEVGRTDSARDKSQNYGPDGDFGEQVVLEACNRNDYELERADSEHVRKPVECFICHDGGGVGRLTPVADSAFRFCTGAFGGYPTRSWVRAWGVQMGLGERPRGEATGARSAG